MDKIIYKAVTPNLLMSEDGSILIEKKPDDDNYSVLFYHSKLKAPKERLFRNEVEADEFIKYLTNGNI